MKYLPVISVIIPVYNKEKTIERTLISVFRQEYRSIQVVIIDDGSTDDSTIVIQNLQKEHHAIEFIRQENTGPGHARNVGLDRATGDYVVFLDADDEWEPDFLTHAVNTFQEHKDINVYAASHYRTSSGQKKSYSEFFSEFGVPRGKFKVTSSMSVYSLLGLVWFFHSSMIVSKISTIKRYGGFYDHNKSVFGEDSYLWIQVLLNETGFCELEPLGWYHTEDSSLCGAGPGLEKAAFLRFPERLRETCPESMKDLLEKLLGVFNLLYMLSSLGKTRNKIQSALSSYPGLKSLNDGKKFESTIRKIDSQLLELSDQLEVINFTRGPKLNGPW
ncbi:glycosyltransferase family 2 protein [Microbulbifer sp. JMSA004]|uniref:glycosyltransferase family 2 protein n=1 Tax=unclassified Microbulbifer TaxID=2619833 RepID=UPI0024AC9EED|nr:glycosyltransferase family A protein [Microbulbifer sp. VAAF005]WHI44691.1 glycosyltransferase family A protein [Microbulbifer sp. VAAF005]